MPKVVLGSLDQEFIAEEIESAIADMPYGKTKVIQVGMVDGRQHGCVPPEWGPCPIYGLVFSNEYLTSEQVQKLTEEALEKQLAEISET